MILYGARRKPERAENRLQAFSIRPVLTAHPTQFYPGRVLAIITDLTDAIHNDPMVSHVLKQLEKLRSSKRQSEPHMMRPLTLSGIYRTCSTRGR